MKPLHKNSRKPSGKKFKKPFTIAIDGPAGSGKSTAAYLLAKELGLTYMDTGAMYRALTWKALKNRIDLENEKILSKMAEVTQISIFSRDSGPGTVVYVDGKEISTLLRTPRINKWVSVVSKAPGVRRAMAKLQRDIARKRSVVAEGRDMGTVVFPQAEVKIFLIASVEERARRRWKEFQQKGLSCTREDIKKELQLRDKIDSERELAPLKKAPDAILVDNTNLNIRETVEKLLNIINAKAKILTKNQESPTDNQ